jgi:hypothetical protein
MRERAAPDDRDRGLFAYGIFASIAEFERELIRIKYACFATKNAAMGLLRAPSRAGS